MSLNNASWHWEGVRERSEALFGSPYRLRVALLSSLATSDELYAASIARAAGISNKEATRELAHLEAAELLSPASSQPPPTGRGRPPKLLERHDEQSWRALQALGDRFRQTPPKPPRGQPRG